MSNGSPDTGYDSNNLLYSPGQLQSMYGALPSASVQLQGPTQTNQAGQSYRVNADGTRFLVDQNGASLGTTAGNPNRSGGEQALSPQQAQFVSNLGNQGSPLHKSDMTTWDKIMQAVNAAGVTVAGGMLAGPALVGALGPVAGGAAAGALGGAAGAGLQGQDMGRGALAGAVTGGLGGTDLAGNLTYGMTDAFGVPLGVAKGLVGAGTGALSGLATGQGAGKGALSGALQQLIQGYAPDGTPSLVTKGLSGAVPGIINGNLGQAILGGVAGAGNTVSPGLGSSAALLARYSGLVTPSTSSGSTPSTTAPAAAVSPSVPVTQPTTQPTKGLLPIQGAQPTTAAQTVTGTSPATATQPTGSSGLGYAPRQQTNQQNIDWNNYGSGPEQQFFAPSG